MAVLNTLRMGSYGPQVELLQLALMRAGFNPGGLDGIFGQQTALALKNFQKSERLTPDAIAGRQTWDAISPYLTGYLVKKIRTGDTLYRLATSNRTNMRAIETANPGLDVFNLTVGKNITIPLGFDVVPVNISFTSTVLEFCVRGLTARYPFLQSGSIGTSVMGRDLYYLTMGTGSHQVFYNASHHANEWITSPLLMKYLENYAKSYAFNGTIFNTEASALFNMTKLYMVPMVNPDGVDIVTGEIASGRFYEQAKSMAAQYPSIPFPSGWKANINGIDLNLQYPAGWEEAKKIKFSQGYTMPGPRDYVGSRPLEAPESRGMYQFTRAHDYSLTTSYHTQGRVIYWKYANFIPPNSFEIAQKFSEVSGYGVEDTPYESGYAGYKDWFISQYNRPGYTIEAGVGIPPLPLSQFQEIYNDNEGILTIGLTATV